MFSLNEGNRYVVCLRGVDLCKGLDGLYGLIRYLSLSHKLARAWEINTPDINLRFISGVVLITEFCCFANKMCYLSLCSDCIKIVRTLFFIKTADYQSGINKLAPACLVAMYRDQVYGIWF